MTAEQIGRAVQSPQVDVWQERVRRASRVAGRGTQAWARGYLSGADRHLPDFVIVGGQRCGTTSLYHYLSAHPGIAAPLVKEVQFFSLRYRRGLRWYLGNFPRTPPGVRTFEASPYYLFDERVPGRLVATLPQAKILVLLRDPVERAYSHYLHTRSLGHEKLDFRSALREEQHRLAKVSGRYGRHAHHVRRSYSYATRGRYADQLERWFAHVDRERVLAIRSEDMYRDPGGTHRQILEFLGLPPHQLSAYRQHTLRVDPGETELTPDLRQELRREFASADARLATMLGWDRTWGDAAGLR